MARAERLVAGPAGKTGPRWGTFPSDEGRGELQEPSLCTYTPRFFLGIFHPGIHGFRAPL
jgi:hypothetical protein